MPSAWIGEGGGRHWQKGFVADAQLFTARWSLSELTPMARPIVSARLVPPFVDSILRFRVCGHSDSKTNRLLFDCRGSATRHPTSDDARV
jgi:hypothetical protein